MKPPSSDTVGEGRRREVSCTGEGWKDRYTVLVDLGGRMRLMYRDPAVLDKEEVVEEDELEAEVRYNLVDDRSRFS